MARCLWVWLLAAAISASRAASAAPAQHPDVVRGYQAWTRGEWSTASSLLIRYWQNEQYSKTYDVAFWLGTSWCRLAGYQTAGADLLDWSYHYHSMPEKERQKFRTERDLCIQGFGPAQPYPRPVIMTSEAWSNATMRAEGKTFYFVNGGAGVMGYPVRLKRKLPVEQFAARLFPLSDQSAAVQAARARVPEARIAISKHFVIASLSPELDLAALERIGDQLERFMAFIVKTYVLPAPNTFVTVYLVPSASALQKWADDLHGFDASPATLGYSLQNDLSMLAVLTTPKPGTLLHELFHLIARSSYGSIPQWLDEGIASLYESASQDRGTYFGEPNWRGPVFNQLRPRFGSSSGLGEVIASAWFSDEPSLQPGDVRAQDPEQQAYVLAYARLFALYLQEQGKLQAVFSAFENRRTPVQFTPAPTQAVKLVEDVLGKPLATIEREFDIWVPAALDPDRKLHRGESVQRQLPSPPAADRQ